MNIKQFIFYNLIALVILVVSRFLSFPFDEATSDLGNLLWFPIGAAILSYLLFGFKVFPGVLLGYIIAEMIIEGGVLDITQREVLKRTASALAPVISIGIMRMFTLSNFFDDEKINPGHIVFLIFLSAIISTLLKALLIDNQLPDLDSYITTYLIGDMIGGMIFIYMGIKVFTTFFAKKKLI
jgi:integral membrane sensor domain MASE1